MRTRAAAGFPIIAGGLTCLTVSLLLAFIHPALLEPVELWTVDQRFRVRPSPRVKSEAAVAIDYDDRAARELGLGRWPWNRRVHAEVIDWMREAGARVVVLDMLFDIPTDPEQDRALAEATARAGNVVHAFLPTPVPEAQRRDDFRRRAPKHVLEADHHGNGELVGAGEVVCPLPSLLEAATGLGHILRTADVDGVVRRTPLLLAIRGGGVIPALGLIAAMRHLEVDVDSLRIDRGRAIRFTSKRHGHFEIPIDERGRTWINYGGPWSTRFRHYPYSWLHAQVRSPTHRPGVLAAFKDKIVLVANLTTGSADLGPTPLERDSPLGEVHLHLANMVLTRQVLRDATVSETMLAQAVPLAVVTLSALLGGPSVILPVSMLALLAYIAATLLAFATGVVLPVALPVLSLAATVIALLATRSWIVDRDRKRFLAALGACLPPQTVEQIHRNRARISELLAPKRRELTILFADIKGFSTFAQKADPLEVQRVLREYLAAMTAIIRAHGGTLDKYMGDGILAFFGDAQPVAIDEEAEESNVEQQAGLAVATALAMQRKMTELNDRRERQGRARHLIRIGLNTGVVTVGNLGTEQLWDYTVVGHEVNKAQRLESKAPPGGVLLARRTYALAAKLSVLPADLPGTSEELKGLGPEDDLYVVHPERVEELCR